MSRNSSPSTGMIVLHFVLTILTGGLWLLFLIIRWLLKH